MTRYASSGKVHGPERGDPLAHIRPRKSLGQNFLRDENVARKIVRAINPQPSDVMLEIGPGEGVLTKYLVPAVGKLIAVDVDDRVIERTRAAFPRIDVVHKDVLDVDLLALAKAHDTRLRVVGNIPYNITSPILFHVLDQRSAVRDVVLMVQKEVAQRLVARPGSKEYGILAVSFQVFADVELLFDVSRNVFHPKPDVTSAVIALSMRMTPRYTLHNEEVFRSMVRSIFGKRRKMLRASLKYFCDARGYALPSTIDLTRRPESMTPDELVRMSNSLAAGSGAANA
jgi:16S rRNA (adenine1518-N6/adenine1519-N6)-dimethyltransferase